jgi:hypothetical protein
VSCERFALLYHQQRCINNGTGKRKGLPQVPCGTWEVQASSPLHYGRPCRNCSIGLESELQANWTNMLACLQALAVTVSLNKLTVTAHTSRLVNLSQVQASGSSHSGQSIPWLPLKGVKHQVSNAPFKVRPVKLLCTFERCWQFQLPRVSRPSFSI